MAAEDAGRKAQEHGMKELEVCGKGPGSGRESALRGLQSRRFHIRSIKDITPCRTTAAARVSAAASNNLF
jgi:small subunit ribosomal protein S11